MYKREFKKKYQRTVKTMCTYFINLLIVGIGKVIRFIIGISGYMACICIHGWRAIHSVSVWTKD